MSRRPRLVHEGSPIVDDGGADSRPSVNNFFGGGVDDDGDGARVENSRRRNLASSTGGAPNGGVAAKAKPFKLQTRLVVEGPLDDGAASSHVSPTAPNLRGSGGSDDDLDLEDMMMDDDENREHSMNMYNHHDASSSHGAVANGGGAGQHHGHPRQNYEEHHHNQHAHNMQQEHQQHQHNQHALHQPHYHHNQQQMHMQHTNEFHDGHHGFGHATAATPPPPPIHQMPPPSAAPLVVLDAANIAYNYAESLNPCWGGQKRQPDPRGIRLAVEYFLKNQCRVQAVVPTTWYQLKPRPADRHHLQSRGRVESDAKMVTDEVEELRNLRQEGFLVACPPGDDDDAYALALARREEDRLLEYQRRQRLDESMEMEESHDVDDTAKLQGVRRLPKSVLGGYVVSNDFFADAINRDQRKRRDLPLNLRPLPLRRWLDNHRISYSFANVGEVDADGGIRLEFLPNPRSDLIAAIDAYGQIRRGMH